MTQKYTQILSLVFIFNLFCLSIYAQEICNNGIDDDGDGLIDCYDNDCGDSLACNDFFMHFPSVDTACLYYPIHPPFGLKELWVSSDTVDVISMHFVGDMDDDGIPEVLGTYSRDKDGFGGVDTSRILIFDGQSGKLKKTIRVPDQYRTGGTGGFTGIADINADGKAEIFCVVGEGDNNMFIDGVKKYLLSFDMNGNLLWISSDTLDGADYWNYPQFANFNGDDSIEVYIGRNIFNAHTGQLIARAGNSYVQGDEWWMHHSSLAVDVLPDSYCPKCSSVELVVGNQVFSIDIDSSQANLEVTAPYGLPPGYVVSADMNNDDSLDIVVNSRDSFLLYAWDPRINDTIRPIFSMSSNGLGGYPNIGNFDSDSLVEIGIAGENFYVSLDNDFSLVWQMPITDLTSGITGSSLFDFDCDGKMEIAYRDERYLWIFDAETGNILDSISCLSGTFMEYPVIADINGDQHAEIICNCEPPVFGTTFSFIKAFGSENNDWAATRKAQNQFHYFAVNVNDDLTIPRNQQNHANSALPVLNGFFNQPSLLDQYGNPLCFIISADATANIDSFVIDCDSVSLYLSFCNIQTEGEWIYPGMEYTLYQEKTESAVIQIFSGSLQSPIPSGTCMQLNTKIVRDDSIDYKIYLFSNDTGNSYAQAPMGIFPECDLGNNEDSAFIQAQPTPYIISNTDTAICYGDSVLLIVNSNYNNYHWTPATNISDTNIANPYAFPETTTYYIVSSSDSFGCTKSDSILIKINQFNVGVEPDTTIYRGACVQLKSNIAYKGSYRWNPSTYLNSDSIYNPLSCPDSSIIYLLLLTDSSGCTYTDSLLIEVIEGSLITIPSAFSPNNDKLNDELYPFYYGIKRLDYFKIFNRWGELVFESNDLTKSWDGTYLAELQEGGIYIYKLKAMGYDNKEHALQGTFLLIR